MFKLVKNFVIYCAMLVAYTTLIFPKLDKIQKLLQMLDPFSDISAQTSNTNVETKLCERKLFSQKLLM